MEFNIKGSFGEIGKSGSWSIELNLVQWGEYQPKYDIRAWSDDHSQMGKGISLTKEQLVNLRNLLEGLDL